MYKRFTEPRRRQRGSMMLEATIGLAMGAMIILAACSLMTVAAANGVAARQNDTAYNALRQAIENVRIYKAAKTATGTFDGTTFGAIPQLASLPDASVSVTISTYRSPVKQVTATIIYRVSGKSVTKTRTLTSLIGPGGITP